MTYHECIAFALLHPTQKDCQDIPFLRLIRNQGDVCTLQQNVDFVGIHFCYIYIGEIIVRVVAISNSIVPTILNAIVVWRIHYQLALSNLLLRVMKWMILLVSGQLLHH